MGDRQREVEAAFYVRLADGRVRCDLCPVHCVVRDGHEGRCRVRKASGGRLIAAGYGQTVSANVDPIEKKPLYHFLPASAILSIGCNGCNLRCLHCQNWEISQTDVPTMWISPEDLAELGASRGSVGVSFTYTEPIVWYEYIRDSSPLIRKKGGAVVLVTNGYIESEPLAALLPLVDAMNVDVKAMDEGFYREVAGGRAEVPRRTVEAAAAAGVHVEVTYLVITGYNDSDAEVDRFIDWAASVDRSMPVHFSRYFPHHKLNAPATPVETVAGAVERASKKLDYVYAGNVHGRSDTRCPRCGSVLIERWGYSTRVVGLKGGDCGLCGRPARVVVSVR